MYKCDDCKYRYNYNKELSTGNCKKDDKCSWLEFNNIDDSTGRKINDIKEMDVICCSDYKKQSFLLKLINYFKEKNDG